MFYINLEINIVLNYCSHVMLHTIKLTAKGITFNIHTVTCISLMINSH